MTMQNNIDISRRALRRNVNQTKFYSAAHKIDNQWPFEIGVAISTDHLHGPTGRAQFVEDPFRANIAQMPDFIDALSQDRQLFRKLVVRIGENEYAPRVFHLRESRTKVTTFTKVAALKLRRDPLRPLCEALTFSRVI